MGLDYFLVSLPVISSSFATVNFTSELPQHQRGTLVRFLRQHRAMCSHSFYVFVKFPLANIEHLKIDSDKQFTQRRSLYIGKLMVTKLIKKIHAFVECNYYYGIHKGQQLVNTMSLFNPLKPKLV
jgi:hypothetical protein